MNSRELINEYKILIGELRKAVKLAKSLHNHCRKKRISIIQDTTDIKLSSTSYE